MINTLYKILKMIQKLQREYIKANHLKRKINRISFQDTLLKNKEYEYYLYMRNKRIHRIKQQIKILKNSLQSGGIVNAEIFNETVDNNRKNKDNCDNDLNNVPDFQIDNIHSINKHSNCGVDVANDSFRPFADRMSTNDKNLFLKSFYDNLVKIKPRKHRKRLKIKNFFTKREFKGNAVDLRKIFKDNCDILPPTYKDYLHSLADMKLYKNQIENDRCKCGEMNFSDKSQPFKIYFYLKDIYKYFNLFVKKTYPSDFLKIRQMAKSATDVYKEKFALECSFFKQNLFCVPCQRAINKKVFHYHVKGKKHKNNLSVNRLSKTDNKIDSANQENKKTVFIEKRCSKEREKENIKYIKTTLDNFIYREGVVRFYLHFLKNEIETAIFFLENVPEKPAKTKYSKENFVDNDGKPIPGWLYKLYGLDVTYECEICSRSFRGRKAFDRHFYGIHKQKLRELGLKTGKIMYGITSLEIAKKIGAKTIGDEEEIEDEEGNVYDRKSYEKLKDFGLI